MNRRTLLGKTVLAIAVLGPLGALALCHADPTQQDREKVTEPVYRVAKSPITQTAAEAVPVAPQHPLDPALTWANEGLERMRREVRDYTATMVKRERVNGELTEAEHMFVKIRNRKIVDGQVAQPFSIYLQFLKPVASKGREVIWVEGKNNGKMVAHEGGRAGAWLPTVWIPPNGFLAMRGQRYPLTDAGLENLIIKLIEKGERDRKRDECEVQFFENAKVNDRSCTVIQVVHPHPRPYFDFHMARIFIDNEHQLPIRYAAYQWPSTPGGEPVLDEEYTYLNLKVNVGLTDADFDPYNKAYNFYK